MKKIILLAMLCTLLCTAVTYAYHGTYTPLDITAIKTQGQDDEHFVMEGKFVDFVQKDEYIFEDNNGERITVEVAKLATNTLVLGNYVRVYGEIDIDHGVIEVEIECIENL